MERQGRILFADNEDTFCEAQADHLRKEGYVCDCAGDSKSAAKLIGMNEYDLLIADIRMPGNENLEFLYSLSKKKPTLPVIIVTAYATVETAVDSIQLPVVGYFRKPYDQKAFNTQVRLVMGRSQIRKIISQSKSNLQSWKEELEKVESSVIKNTEGDTYLSVDAYLSLTLNNILNNLADIRGLTEAFAGMTGEKYACQMLNCPRAIRLTAGIKETLRVLEKTKKSFKSKELAELRQKLETLLRSEGI
ncbi:MAG: response regulator [bacterium]|nr:response regulator [bacterium]